MKRPPLSLRLVSCSTTTYRPSYRRPTDGAYADFLLADLRTRTELPVTRDLESQVVPEFLAVSFLFSVSALPGAEYQIMSPWLWCQC